MEIYRTGNRLVMILEVQDDFSFDDKKVADESNPSVQKWEELMWNYQQALPHSKAGEKWILMEKIFETKSKKIG
jgi:L-rhamnose mutarotase